MEVLYAAAYHDFDFINWLEWSILKENVSLISNFHRIDLSIFLKKCIINALIILKLKRKKKNKLYVLPSTKILLISLLIIDHKIHF